MKHVVVVRYFLLAIFLLVFSQHSVQAQSSTVSLNVLMVELWLEYDQPEVLVIYRGQLSPNIALPATVTFPIPAYVDEMHAVAIEDGGELFNVNPDTIELARQDDNQVLSFQVNSPGFQFEYYDPEILSRQDQLRRLDYTFTAAHPIATLVLEVQEPAQAQDFLMTPEPERSFVAQNTLPHHTVRRNDLAPGETVTLTASYSRPTDAMSVGSVPPGPPDEPLDIAVISGTPISQNLNIGYILLGAGLLLLLGTGGYWWWSKRSAAALQARSRDAAEASPGRLRKKKNGQPARRAVAVQSPRSAAASEPGGYCYRCGTALRPDAEFCHACGAQRRRD